MIEDFDVIHNIFYYLYTREITFSTEIDKSNCFISEELPKLCSAKKIYQLAHRLEMIDLQEKAVDFFKETCTLENIASRVFGEFAYVYKDVKKAYAKYFKKNWKEINKASEFIDYMKNLEEAGDFAEMTYAFRQFRKLMKGAEFD